MKKNAARYLAASLAALCLFFGGCAPASRPLLWYQDALVSADLTVGERSYRLSAVPGGYAVTVLAPMESAGVTFTVTDVSSFVSYGEVEIPVTESMTAGASRLIALFTLEDARVSEVTPDKKANTVRARIRDAAGNTVFATFGPDGLPVSFETDTGLYTVTNCQTGADS